MKVWVLFVWLSGPIPTANTELSKAECERRASNYKHATCILVDVPKK